jgi:hypothetical protein
MIHGDEINLNLNFHIHLVLILRMHGATPPLPYTFSQHDALLLGLKLSLLAGYYAETYNYIQDVFFFYRQTLYTRSNRKAPRLGQKRNAGLTYSILAAISFKTDSLGTYTAILSLFSCFKSTVEVIFLNAVEYHL